MLPGVEYYRQPFKPCSDFFVADIHGTYVNLDTASKAPTTEEVQYYGSEPVLNFDLIRCVNTLEGCIHIDNTRRILITAM